MCVAQRPWSPGGLVGALVSIERSI
eukprot:SAG25_NODE_5669_length_633_cov_1.052434_2_plen_24_part_01